MSGDVNCDGTCGETVAAYLFRWLLQERIVLQNWNAVDFDGGSTLNAVDLTLLKRGRAVPDLENAS